MADGIEIKVDTTRAIAKLGRITPQVRDNLRKVIPDLTKALGKLIGAKLDSGLKSRKTLTVAQELHESVNRITGVARVEASASSPKLLPTYLEEGTRPHEIIGNPVLAFPWDKLGGATAFFRKVNHPGFAGLHFMEKAFSEMQEEIVGEIKAAVKEAAHEADR